MTLLELLQSRGAVIVDDAIAAADRAHLQHYESSGPDATRERFRALFDLVVQSIAVNSPAPIKAHAEVVAEERYRTGFGLGEVQTAFNLLEEASWKWIVRELEPTQLGEALGQVTTVLGAAKDSLSRRYVMLATRTGAPTLRMDAMMKGTTTA
jgi:hypothetical protein